MIRKIIDWFKRRTCKHAFVQIEQWMEKSDDMTYPVRLYECMKCGIHVKNGKPF